MMQKAHEISLEAGSKMATVMKDVIFAAAGLTPFAAESARDLVNYMVRRGQMGAEEAERIRRDIEAAAEKRGGPMRPAGKPMAKDEPKTLSPFTRPPTPVTPMVAVAPPRPPAPAPAPEAVVKKPAAVPEKKPVVAKAPVAKKPAAAPKKPAAAKKPAPKKK
jgi:hypothetical protein